MARKFETHTEQAGTQARPSSRTKNVGNDTRNRGIPAAEALGHLHGELVPWQTQHAVALGYGNEVPAAEREVWDEEAFVLAYNARCDMLGVPGFSSTEQRLAYLATYTYPASGCPTLAAFAEQRVECDLFNG